MSYLLYFKKEGESEIHFVTVPLAYHSDIFASYKMKLEAEQGKTVKSVMGMSIFRKVKSCVKQTKMVLFIL